MNQFVIFVTRRFRDRSRLLAVLASVALAPAAWASQPVCGPDRVESSVEVAAGEFTLADLLASSSCPAIRRAAAAVPMGRAPLAGSVRVFDGEAVWAEVEKLAASGGNGALRPSSVALPERITVRRAGARASCVELAQKLLGGAGSTPATTAAAGRLALRYRPAGDVTCGVAGRIPETAPLELMRETWDAGSETWEISARCARPQDCVPFLVRVRGRDRQVGPVRPVSAKDPGEDPAEDLAEDPAGGRPATRAQAADRLPEASTVAPSFAYASETVAAPSVAGPPLVRPGETATLSWDQDGIRLVVPVVCLDRGGLGQTVRARILAGSRTLEAVVTGPGLLRARP
jgi:Chaperone for flagella basal body P-ring formation